MTMRWGLAIILGICVLPSLALGQATDYSAGKTPAQLFSGDCSACHKSPRGLAKTRDPRSLAGFLREHYTTKGESAGALAAYLLGNPGTPADARNAAAEAAKRQGVTPGATPGAPPGTVPGSQRAARGEPGEDDTNIVVPEGRAGAKPGDAKPGDKTRGKAKKPDPAEVAREAARLAEEAAKAKVRAYATAGEGARPLVPAEAAPAAPEAGSEHPPAAPSQNSTADPAPPAEAKPAAESKPAGEDRPAAPPPG